MKIMGISSVGRAPIVFVGGRGFKPCIPSLFFAMQMWNVVLGMVIGTAVAVSAIKGWFDDHSTSSHATNIAVDECKNVPSNEVNKVKHQTAPPHITSVVCECKLVDDRPATETHKSDTQTNDIMTKRGRRKKPVREKKREAFWSNQQWVAESRQHVLVDSNVFIPNMHANVCESVTGGSTPSEVWFSLICNPSVESVRLLCVVPLQLVVRVSMTKKEECRVSARWSHKRRIVKYILKRQQWIPISIRDRVSGRSHANMLWIDHVARTVELFDPNGHKWKSKSILVRQAIQFKWLTIFPDYQWIEEENSYPLADTGRRLRGPQSFADDHNCGWWCALFVHLKSINSTRTSREIWAGWFRFLKRVHGAKWAHHLTLYMQRYRFWARDTHRIFHH